MKIALCLSGGLRNYKDTFYSIKHHLLDTMDVDVFFYGIENKEGREQNELDFQAMFNPKKMIINYTSFYDSLQCKHTSSSLYYMFYNIMKCNELKKQYEKDNNIIYDIVIRSRLDCFWFRSLDDMDIINAQTHILFPKEWSFKNINSFALSDIFAIGNSDLMDTYANVYNYIDIYCEKIQFHPESICGYHIMINNIPHIECDRHIIFEYPSERIEKHIFPFKFIRYLLDDDISNEDEYIQIRSNRRKLF